MSYEDDAVFTLSISRRPIIDFAIIAGNGGKCSMVLLFITGAKVFSNVFMSTPGPRIVIQKSTV